MVGCETHFFFMLPERELEEKIAGIAGKTGYRIIELLVRGEKRTKVLEVFVDREDGVNVDELAGISRDIEEELENSAFSSEFSKIVVSSPGIDRPFRYLWQLQKHKGRTLEGSFQDGTKFEGKIADIDADSGEVVLLVPQPGKKKSEPVEMRISFGNIRDARIKISFSKP